METNELEYNITQIYDDFMDKMSISKIDGILGRIDNKKYATHTLRFSGFPYIGADYAIAKKKILFVGLDIGIDECREDNTYHSIKSRRQCIASDEDRCAELVGYNPHISGTYAVALYILKDYYGWEDSWERLSERNTLTSKKAIDTLRNELPNNVLDYIAFTNIHKFVTKCRGCDEKKPGKCWSEECKESHKSNNICGNENRKWYSENNELQFFMKEIETLNPDIIVFQGSAFRIHKGKINELKSKHKIIFSHHPSYWGNVKLQEINTNPNRIAYAKKIVDMFI